MLSRHSSIQPCSRRHPGQPDPLLFPNQEVLDVRNGSSRTISSLQRLSSLLPLLVALADPTPALAETKPAVEGTAENVSQDFQEAVKLFRSGDPKRALPLFNRVVEATDSPNARLYIGYCLLDLGRPAEAYQAFWRIVEQTSGPQQTKYAATREAAAEQLVALSPLVAKLTILVTEKPEGLQVTVDGKPLSAERLGSSSVLAPGTHLVAAEAPGVKPVSQEMEIKAGQDKTVVLSFADAAAPQLTPQPAPQPAPPPMRDSPLRPLGFIAAGVGVAGVVVFAAAGLEARSAYRSLEEDCPGGCSDRDHLDDIERGRSLQTIANVGLAVGTAGILAGGALLYFGFSEDDGRGVAIDFTPGGARAAYRARF